MVDTVESSPSTLFMFSDASSRLAMVNNKGDKTKKKGYKMVLV